MRHLSIVATGMAGLLVAGAAAQASTISFQNGASNSYVSNYAGTSDTTFNSSGSSGYGDGNWGARNAMSANQSRTWEELEALVRFDLSALTGQGLTVNSATLKLASIAGGGYDNLPVSFYAISAANAGWQQGTGTSFGPSAPDGEATWQKLAESSTNWAGSAGLKTSNTDYNPTAVATGIYNTSDASGTIVSFTLSASQVQSWIDTPSGNAGLVLRTANWSGNPTPIYYANAQYSTSEQSNAALRPELVLEVSAIPEPASLAGLGLLGLFLRRRRA
jgi:hypothetical protein